MRNWDGTLKKPSLVVHADLPEGVVEQPSILRQTREARGWVNGECKNFYHCPNCNGWIEGFPNSYRVNNHAPWALAGRMGSVDDCERCGYELDFLGIMS